MNEAQIEKLLTALEMAHDLLLDLVGECALTAPFFRLYRELRASEAVKRGQS